MSPPAWNEAPPPQGRRPFVDNRVRSEPNPRFAAAPPSVLDGDCARWLGKEPEEVPFTIAGLVPRGMTCGVPINMTPGHICDVTEKCFKMPCIARG